jgi:hypothetical protein
MAKLAALMEWLSLRDAARYLSDKVEDDITEASLLWFGLQGDLSLSTRSSGSRLVSFPLKSLFPSRSAAAAAKTPTRLHGLGR